MNSEQGNQVFDLMGLVRRRGRLIACVSGALILVTYWVAMALPNMYTSAAVILVEPQSVDESLVNSGVKESDLNERLGIMTSEILSRTRLSKIITKFDLYEDEHDDMERFEVVDLMRSYIQVEPVTNAIEGRQARNRDLKFNTFRIVFRHDDPIVARDVTQLVANDFINANINDRTEVTNKSLEFMEDEIESISEELATVEREISEIKATNVGSLPEEFDSNQRTLQFAMADLRAAQRIYDAAMNDAAYWKNQALTALDLSSPTDATSPTNRLRSLELEHRSMLARGFTPRHPDVIRVETEMRMLENQLRSNAEANDGDAPQSLGEQNARAEQGRAELRAAAAAEDVERLRVEIETYEARLASTPAVAERLDALIRRYDQLDRSYQDFSARLQQAGVQADMERRQLGERFLILEPAERPREPSSPNRYLLLALGTALGLALGVGVGLVAEMTDTSLHTSNDLQTALGIPVLVSIPEIMLESDRVERSKKNFREALVAAAIVAFVLVGGVATYLLVNGDFSGYLEEEEDESVSVSRLTPGPLGLEHRRG